METGLGTQKFNPAPLVPWSSLATAEGRICHGVEERAQLYFSGGEARMFSVALRTYLERGKLLKGLS